MPIFIVQMGTDLLAEVEANSNHSGATGLLSGEEHFHIFFWSFLHSVGGKGTFAQNPKETSHSTSLVGFSLYSGEREAASVTTDQPRCAHLLLILMELNMLEASERRDFFLFARF